MSTAAGPPAAPRRRPVVVAALVGALVGGLLTAVVLLTVGEPGSLRRNSTTGTAPEEGTLVVAVGDIACEPDADAAPEECQHAATAETAEDLDPEVVLALGDLQYEDGLLEDFEASYDPTWGAVKDITRPVIGNHEMNSGGEGYHAYFGEAAGEPGRAWYSFDTGGWHLVAVNSECGEECLEPGSEQLQWLEADLAASDARCTLAFWHRPRFSSDDEHGNSGRMDDVWEVLDEAGADLVLASHAHTYERFEPLTSDGEASSDGITSFVVGTGGKSLYGFDEVETGSQVRQEDTFGVLALTLRPDGYDYEFVRAAGEPFEDAGSGTCGG